MPRSGSVNGFKLILVVLIGAVVGILVGQLLVAVLIK